MQSYLRVKPAGTVLINKSMCCESPSVEDTSLKPKYVYIVFSMQTDRDVSKYIGIDLSDAPNNHNYKQPMFLSSDNSLHLT